MFFLSIGGKELKPLIIGQAPGPNTDPLNPLPPLPTQCAGGRLVELAGLTSQQYLEWFDRANLLQFFPGRNMCPDKFPKPMAQIAAEAMKPLLRGRQLILLGRNVAEAFGYPAQHLAWHEWFEDPFWGFTVAVVPHTSGRSHWYRNLDNREQAKRFWERVRHSLQKASMFDHRGSVVHMHPEYRQRWLEGVWDPKV